MTVLKMFSKLEIISWSFPGGIFGLKRCCQKRILRGFEIGWRLLLDMFLHQICD